MDEKWMIVDCKLVNAVKRVGRNHTKVYAPGTTLKQVAKWGESLQVGNWEISLISFKEED